MSQILAQRPKDTVLYSELHFPRSKIQLQSSAKEVACRFCKSELKEGNALTAKKIGDRLVLVCNFHKFR
jgi:hypothetical protein